MCGTKVGTSYKNGVYQFPACMLGLNVVMEKHVPVYHQINRIVKMVKVVITNRTTIQT